MVAAEDCKIVEKKRIIPIKPMKEIQKTHFKTRPSIVKLDLKYVEKQEGNQARQDVVWYG